MYTYTSIHSLHLMKYHEHGAEKRNTPKHNEHSHTIGGLTDWKSLRPNHRKLITSNKMAAATKIGEPEIAQDRRKKKLQQSALLPFAWYIFYMMENTDSVTISN